MLGSLTVTIDFNLRIFPLVYMTWSSAVQLYSHLITVLFPCLNVFEGLFYTWLVLINVADN